MVEHNVANVVVVGSRPITRSILLRPSRRKAMVGLRRNSRMFLRSSTSVWLVKSEEEHEAKDLRTRDVSPS